MAEARGMPRILLKEKSLPARIPYLSNAEIRQRAVDFLTQYHPTGTVPIPIEAIVEVRLRLEKPRDFSVILDVTPRVRPDKEFWAEVERICGPESMEILAS